MTAPDITAAAIETAAAALLAACPNAGEENGKCLADEDECFTAHPVHFAWHQAAQYGVVGDTRAIARAVLEAAVPVLLTSHEKQVREKVAEELVAAAPVASLSGQDLVGPRATLRRHLLIAARRVVGPMTMDEVAHAVERGDFAACYLDEAGQPIARGSRPAADGGGGADA